METEDDGWKPNHWHDVLLKSIQDDITSGKIDKDIAALFGEPYAEPKLEKSNSIRIANPKKLQSDYSLLDGNSVNIQYGDQDDFLYLYEFKVRTDPKNAGTMKIFKQKFEGNVYIEFHRTDGWTHSKQYTIEELSDFQSFMGKIVGVIINQ